jgi:uncharacterized membrane protein YoaK (UPF0700 family)
MAEADTRLRDVRIDLISLVAGSIDALSFLGLGHVFTANMTGNTILLALAISGQVAGLSVIRSSIALIGFASGALFGASLVTLRIEKRLLQKYLGSNRSLEEIFKEADQEEWPAEINHALYAEAVILLAYGILWSFFSPQGANIEVTYLIILLSGIAMGIQSEAIAHLGVWGIVSTYITGTYNSFFAGVARRLNGKNPASKKAYEQASSATGQVKKNTHMKKQRSLLLEASSLIAFGVGAGISGFLVTKSYLFAPWLAIAGLVIVVLLSFV